MFKETVTCIIIIVLIVCLDLFTQNYTKQSVETITEELALIKEEMTLGNKEKTKEKIDELNQKWKEKHDKLAYYIEHDELEKVNTSLVKIKSYIEIEEYNEAIPEITECKYILEHIKEKQRLKIINVF